jgi:uncharacterized membrane protein
MKTPRRTRIAWYLMTLLSIGIAINAWSYLFADGQMPAGGTPSSSDEHYSWLLAQHWLRFASHFVFAPIALLLGPFQFLDGIRKSRPRLHRVLGYIYAAAIGISGSGALILATTSWGGLSTSIGFGLLAVLWLWFTFGAVWHARAGRYATHRRFMVRSFALTFAAVTLRLYIGVFMTQGYSFDEVYQTVAWLSWVPNLMIAEWLLNQRKSPTIQTA